MFKILHLLYTFYYMKQLIALFILITSISVYAQENTFADSNFKHIDSVAKTIKYKGEIALLTYDLTKDYTSELEKSRAIFIWITHNVAYDYKLANKKKSKRKRFKCRKKTNCDAEYAEWKNDYLKKVIDKKKGICNGYAELLHKMCGQAGIQSNVVYGYIKDEQGHIGKMGILDHDWNLVIIDGKQYFLDATWASGFSTKNKKGKLKNFTFKYNDYYWLTPVEKLSRNHFPKDSTWIKHTTYAKAKEAYKNTAFIKEYLMDDIDILQPDSGVIKAKEGDTIRFTISNFKPVKYIQAVSNLENYKTPDEIIASGKEWTQEEVKKQKYLPFSKDGDIYSFYVIADNKRLKHYDIMFNHNQSIRFKVNLVK